MSHSSTTIDYYKILSLPKNSSQEDIAESYRKLSLKFHPKVCSPENSAQSEYCFQKLCEAYEVLSDPIKKEIYDIYGHEGLKNGIIDKKGNIKGGYIYSGNGHEIFEKFMGTANPFTLKGEYEKNFFEEKAKPTISISNNKKIEDILKPIDIDLECTLEELYNGCVKHIKYKKRVIGFDFRTTEEKEFPLDIEVFRGYDKNQRVNKDDLIYTHKIDLAQALNSEPVRLTTLDGRKLAISVDEIISPSTVKIVHGEGMPIFKDEMDVRDLNIKKGDLYIKFDIKFPEYIDPNKKIEITNLLEREE